MTPSQTAAYEEFRSCLLLSCKIISSLEESECEVDDNTTVYRISVEEFNSNWAAEFPNNPLSEGRFMLLREFIGGCLDTHGITSCAIWEIAHAICHALQDEEMEGATIN